MKKLLLMGALFALCAPVFAGPDCDEGCPAKRMNGPRHEMMRKGPADEAAKAKMAAAKAERKARKARFEAAEDKLEKLVKEYKKAKAGSKKQQTAREEIGQVLGTLREEQITMRAEKLKEFEQRLAHMKEGLAKEQEPSAKAAWVDMMTERVIAEDGDLEDALTHYGRMIPPPPAPGAKEDPASNDKPAPLPPSFVYEN